MRIVNQKTRFQIFRSKYKPVEYTSSGTLVRGTGRSQFKLIGSFSIYEIDRKNSLPLSLKTGRNKNDTTSIDEVLQPEEKEELQKHLKAWCEEEDEKQKNAHHEILFHSLVCDLEDVIENFDSIPISREEISAYYNAVNVLNSKLEATAENSPLKKKSGWGRKFIIKK